VRPEERTQTIDELRADLGLSSPATPAANTTLLDSSRKPDFASTSVAAAPPVVGAPHAARTVAAAPSRTLLWSSLGGAAMLIAAVGAYLALTPGQPGHSPLPATAAEAPPAVASPAPVTAPPPSFDINRELDQVLGAQTAGFGVSAKPDKTQLRIDKDNLGFSLSSQRDGYVTVLVHGPDGSLIRLIPSSEMRSPRIKSGQTLKLPPAGVMIGTTEPAGPEEFLVIVSSQPRDYAALKPREEGGYLMLPTGAEAAALKAGRAGSALPLLLGQAKGCDGGAGCDDYGAARFKIDVLR
jgi:Domain of unknown function (DUF4384)